MCPERACGDCHRQSPVRGCPAHSAWRYGIGRLIDGVAICHPDGDLVPATVLRSFRHHREGQIFRARARANDRPFEITKGILRVIDRCNLGLSNEIYLRRAAYHPSQRSDLDHDQCLDQEYVSDVIAKTSEQAHLRTNTGPVRRVFQQRWAAQISGVEPGEPSRRRAVHGPCDVSPEAARVCQAHGGAEPKTWPAALANRARAENRIQPSPRLGPLAARLTRP